MTTDPQQPGSSPETAGEKQSPVPFYQTVAQTLVNEGLAPEQIEIQ